MGRSTLASAGHSVSDRGTGKAIPRSPVQLIPRGDVVKRGVIYQKLNPQVSFDFGPLAGPNHDRGRGVGF